jgi:serine/threonine protein kinase
LWSTSANPSTQSNPQPNTHQLRQYTTAPPKPSLITNSPLLPTFGSWDAPSLRFVQDTRSSALFSQILPQLREMPLQYLANYRIPGGAPLSAAICGLMKTANQSAQITRAPSERGCAEYRRGGRSTDRYDEGPMIETVGTQLEEKEVELFSDLLEKMLMYDPEKRITIQEVVRHPWFEYTSSQ